MENAKVAARSIQSDLTIISSMKKMDELMVKLLFVFENNKFIGLLSIGDLQRAIIDNFPNETPIKKILRSEITASRDTESFERIKQRMLQYRTECMPVLNENGQLTTVYFWEDIFQGDFKKNSELLELPVVIMAGGKGTRLKPLTNIIPKPLVPLGEKPIVEIIVDSFVKTGVNQFYFSVNYKADMIERYFNEVKDKKYSIEYFVEDKPLGTAGSLSLLKGKIKTSFFVSNCDIIINQDYTDIYKYHTGNKNELTLVAALKHVYIPYGTLEAGDGGLLQEIREKPEITFLVNAGMYILEPSLLDEIPNDEFFHITDLIDKVKERGGRIGVFPISEGAWMDIGEWKEYNQTMQKLGLGSIIL